MNYVILICVEWEVLRGEELNDFFIWVLFVVWLVCIVKYFFVMFLLIMVMLIVVYIIL